MKNTFVFYTEWIEQIRILEESGTPEDREAFWGALQAFLEGEELPEMTAMAKLVVNPMKNQIARDTAKYTEISEKRRQARTKDDKQEQTITNTNKSEQKLTNATDDEDVDDDEDVSPNGDVVVGAEPVIGLPLNDGSEHGVTEEDLAEYSRLYPAVDVMQQLRNMRGWLLANPQKRKTRRGIKAFITSWLAKEQDRPRARSGTTRKMTAEEILSIPAINPWEETAT